MTKSTLPKDKWQKHCPQRSNQKTDWTTRTPLKPDDEYSCQGMNAGAISHGSTSGTRCVTIKQ